MPLQPMSYTLPGVTILTPDATGPQYSRWRRGVKSAFEAKGLWGHCDGTDPMPMPASGPNFFTPVVAANPQPELLEERKAWMKKDRDVKLDIFLSVTDDIKLEVFEVGPPLPPPTMKASEMIEALDERFKTFTFEEYHHAFCHFLNLHIDQYSSLEEFNAEFKATMEDLLDHGYPLDNLTASSAYFSKLRCTQNPWVATKLKEWDSLSTPPQLDDLMKECPPWMIIRPLAMKGPSNAQHSAPPSYTEELMRTPSLKEVDEDTDSDNHSEISTPPQSAPTSAPHSRNSSTHNFSHSRNNSKHSIASAHTQEITIHASVEDLTELSVFPMPAQKFAKAPTSVPLRLSSKSSILKMNSFTKLSISSPIPPPVDRPLPPLPLEAVGADAPQRSASPKGALVPTLKTPTPPSRPATPSQQKPAETPTTTESAPQTPPQKQSAIHPALRASTPTPTTSTPTTSKSSSPNLAIPSTPEPQRPQSSQGAPTLSPPRFSPDLTKRPSSSRSPGKSSPFAKSTTPLIRMSSTASSTISLPLQGATVPEYQDTIMSGNGSSPSIAIATPAAAVGLGLQMRDEKASTTTALIDPSRLSSSPPRSLMSRLSAELNDEDRKSRKRSWSIKARLSSRRYEIKEII